VVFNLGLLLQASPLYSEGSPSLKETGFMVATFTGASGLQNSKQMEDVFCRFIVELHRRKCYTKALDAEDLTSKLGLHSTEVLTSTSIRNLVGLKAYNISKIFDV
jgi:hypothetical protein